MSYRERFYAKYASVVHPGLAAESPAAMARRSRGYDTYLRGWLPQKKDAEIVDVACGTGWLLKFFADRAYTNVLGLDISPEQADLARKNHPNVVCANSLEYLASKQSAIDLMVGIDVIEHLTKDEVLTFLETAFAALRPGGRLVLQTPNADSSRVTSNLYGDFTHELCFNPRSIAQVLQISGFEQVECRPQQPVAHGAASAARAVLWKLMWAREALRSMIETGGIGSGVYTRVFLASAVKPGARA